MKKLIIITFAILSVLSVIAQNESPKINDSEKKQVIDSIVATLKKSYIFEDVAIKMSDFIKKNFADGKYKTMDNPTDFGYKLTEDLQSISKDKHLVIGFSPEKMKMLKETKIDSSEIMMAKSQEKILNYGFEEVKILSYGIGYLKLNMFSELQEGMETAVAAMNFLSNSDAIIIDLRENGGGCPDMIQLISSYLFDGQLQHLNSLYWRESNFTAQRWTLPFVPGNKSDKADIYILTSGQTFSAAEEFTYNLKNMKRATIVGETTGGGAHPIAMKILNDNYIMYVPIGRAINPITNTNWEGTGVEPDIKTSSDKAYDVAYITALKKLSEKTKDEIMKFRYTWVFDGLDAKNNPPTLNENILKNLVGIYGPRTITYENGNLYYQREGRPKYKMIALKQDYFALEGMNDFRLKFISQNDKITAIEGIYDDGRKSRNDKNK